MDNKTCTSCGKTKPFSDFGRNKSNPDGHQFWCRACFAAYHQDHAKGIRRTPPPPPAGMKRCTRCKALKSVDQFSKGSREADGLQDNCRDCNRKVSAEYRAANVEKERERHAKYHAGNKDKIHAKTSAWQRAHPEQMRARSRRFYVNNLEKERARQNKWSAQNKELKRSLTAAWRAANPDRCKAYEREYLRLNKDKVNAKQARRRARLIHAFVPWANPDKIRAFYAEAQRRTRSTGIEHHVDHIVPLISKMVCGLHCEDNLQILTESENSRKNNTFTVE